MNLYQYQNTPASRICRAGKSQKKGLARKLAARGHKVETEGRKPETAEEAAEAAKRADAAMAELLVCSPTPTHLLLRNAISLWADYMSFELLHVFLTQELRGFRV